MGFFGRLQLWRPFDNFVFIDEHNMNVKWFTYLLKIIIFSFAKSLQSYNLGELILNLFAEWIHQYLIKMASCGSLPSYLLHIVLCLMIVLYLLYLSWSHRQFIFLLHPLVGLAWSATVMLHTTSGSSLCLFRSTTLKCFTIGLWVKCWVNQNSPNI